MKYDAKQDYQSTETARTYEQRAMYNGIIGGRRVKIETNVINKLASQIEPGSVVLDCPCGNGRWLSALAKNASQIIARDISVGMIDFAKERAADLPIKIDVELGDAEKINLPDASVDYTFSYALMKHLPLPMQYKVLEEFGRVTSKKVFCSFAVLTHLSYAKWRRNRQAESFPIFPEELEFMAKSAGLELEKLVKVSQPIFGLEYFAVLKKLK